MNRKFKGGRKKYRDKWYGYDNKYFQNWWHRQEKQKRGNRDIENADEVKEMYTYWVSMGCPKYK